MNAVRRLAAALAILSLGASLSVGASMDIAAAQTRRGAAPAASKARPDIVGVVRLNRDIPATKRTAEIPVVILRGHQKLDRVANNTPLYPDDRVFLKKGAASPVEAIIHGETKKLDARYIEGEAGLPVPHSKGAWPGKRFAELVGLWPAIFDPPKPRPPVRTTPDGTKGAVIEPVEPARLLPVTQQVLTVGRGRVVLPVVWAGGPAMVRFSRQCSIKVEEKFSDGPGFTEIATSRLTDDDYCLEIRPVDTQRRPDRKAGFVIPVKVTVVDRPDAEEQEAVLAAVRNLTGPAGGRLQGLVDIKAEAADSFKAWSVYRSIEDGEQSTPAPRPAVKKRAR